MQKQLFITIVAICIVYTMVAAGCDEQVAPAITGKPSAASGLTVILVENTSVSLPVKQLKSDRDRFMESIHSFCNSVLEGKSR